MATVTKVEELSAAERQMIVGAIELKVASVIRAAKGEKNPTIAELRAKEAAQLNALAIKFS